MIGRALRGAGVWIIYMPEALFAAGTVEHRIFSIVAKRHLINCLVRAGQMMVIYYIIKLKLMAINRYKGKVQQVDAKYSIKRTENNVWNKKIGKTLRGYTEKLL